MGQKIVYYISAIIYTTWICGKKQGIIIQNIITWILDIPLRLFTTKVFRANYYRKLSERQKEANEIIYGMNNSVNIYHAIETFQTALIGYFTLTLSLPIGIILRVYGLNSYWLLVFSFVVLLIYIEATIHYYMRSKRIYIGYFKKFEKYNKKWHRKWQSITIIYYIGSIPSFLVAFVIIISIFTSR